VSFDVPHACTIAAEPPEGPFGRALPEPAAVRAGGHGDPVAPATPSARVLRNTPGLKA